MAGDECEDVILTIAVGVVAASADDAGEVGHFSGIGQRITVAGGEGASVRAVVVGVRRVG